MKESFKKAILVIASFMVFSLEITANCFSQKDHVGKFGKNIGLTSEMYFNTKFSDYIKGTATIVNFDNTCETESFTDVNDWTPYNYTIKSPVSLKNFYVEFWKESFSAGVGFKTFPEREGLVSALQDIEYQFLPVDATSPLRIKRIGVPGVWGKYYFSPDTYVKLVGYDTLWSKISPQTVPDLKRMKLNNPTGDQGYSLFASIGTRIDDTAIEIGLTRGWGSWPSEEREPEAEFSPDPYQFSAAYIKVCKPFDSWILGGTALVKDANEDAGSIYNMLFYVDKDLSLWGKPASIGASYFYVQSFEQSRHLRTSPWEDLGNSIGFRTSIEDRDQQVRYGFEGVVNQEEYGFYLVGTIEKWISDSVKLRSQMDFVYDRQKYVSEEYDSIRIAGFFTYSF